MSYTAYKLSLSEEQIQKLADGSKITLRPEQLSGDDNVLLTKTQINHIEKAKAKAKGVQLQFSERQGRFNASVKEGSGRFGDFFKKVWSGVKSLGSKAAPVAKKGLKWANEQYGDKVQQIVQDAAATQINKISDKLESKLPGKIPGKVGEIIDDAIRRGIETAVAITNEEIRRSVDGLRGSIEGAGFFDFIPGLGPILNEIGNTAWGVVKPVVSNVASNLITKKLGGAYDQELLARYGLDEDEMIIPQVVRRKGKGMKPPGY